MPMLMRLAVLVVVTLVVGVVSLLLLPSDRIASIAADQISRQTGRAVTLEGKTRITLWPILGVSTERFTVANAPWSDAGPMLQAERLKIGVAPQALWGGAVRITGLEASAPQIRLERAADGRVNWQLGVEGVAPSGQSDGAGPASVPRLALTLDRALISQARVSYADHASGQITVLSGLDLDLRWPDYDGAASFDIGADALDGSGGRIALSGRLDPVRAIMEGGLSTLEARLTAQGGALEYAGRISAVPEAQGTLTASLDDTARFLAAFGLAGADIPAGLGRSAALSTQVTLSAGSRIALRDTGLTLDDNRLTGGADLDLSGAIPQVSAQLRAGDLDFSAVTNSGGAEGGDVADGWSTAALDAAPLALVEGEFALVADSVALGDLRLGPTRTRATLTRSRLVFDIAQMQLYGGDLTGEFVINNRSGLSVGGDLRAQGLDLQPLLRDALDLSRLTGRADAEVKFLGVGQSMDSIMSSLSGNGSVATGRGVIDGIDLDRLMRSGNLTGGTTVFDSLTASFTMQGGVLRNSDLLLSLPLARAEGRGRVGLGARDIDYLFTPTLLSGEDRRGLAIPVRIAGPWHSPRITPDLEKAIDLNLQQEREDLEDRVEAERDKLEARALEKVQEELGITVDEGQSVEDAVRDKLEEEVGKGLLRLFD